MFEDLKIAIDKGTRKHKAHVARERGAQRLKKKAVVKQRYRGGIRPKKVKVLGTNARGK